MVAPNMYERKKRSLGKSIRGVSPAAQKGVPANRTEIIPIHSRTVSARLRWQDLGPFPDGCGKRAMNRTQKRSGAKKSGRKTSPCQKGCERTKDQTVTTPFHAALIEKSAQSRRDWIGDRADNLDIAWLRDDADSNPEDLPEPATLAQEAMIELEAAISELQGILAELGEEMAEL